MLLSSSFRKHDILSVLTDKVKTPVTSRGFGLVDMLDRHLCLQSKALNRVQGASTSLQRKTPRHTSMAFVMCDDDADTSQFESCDDILDTLCSHTASTARWRCWGCQTTDTRCLEKADDSTMTCRNCSVVACGVKMVGTHREKACPAQEDCTQHADAPTEAELIAL